MKFNTILVFEKMGKSSKTEKNKKEKARAMNRIKNGYADKLPLRKESMDRIRYLLNGLEKTIPTGFPCFSSETYGSMSAIGISFLFNQVVLGTSDIFLDIGSGIGNVCFYAYFAFQCICIGMEINEERHHLAVSTQGKLMDTLHKTVHLSLRPPILVNSLTFLHMDVTSPELFQAHPGLKHTTVIFVCNLVFSEQLNQSIWNLIIYSFKDCHRVISLKEFHCSRSRSGCIREYADVLDDIVLKKFKSPPGSCSWSFAPVTFYVYDIARKNKTTDN